MSEGRFGVRASDMNRFEDGTATGLGVANWLTLAAAPTFGLMALLTALLGGGHAALLCSQAQSSAPLGGMVPMYVLMSAFHSVPWFKLIAGRRHSARGS